MRRMTVVCCLCVYVVFGNGCGSSEPAPDARMASTEERLKKSLERVSGKQFPKLRLRPDGASGFTGSATAGDGTTYTITGNEKDGVLTYEAKSTSGNQVYQGTEKFLVFALVAKKDIEAGTVIADPLTLFQGGEQYNKGAEPSDIALENHIGLLRGKVVKSAVKTGQVVKLADLAEPNGSPWQRPKN